MMRKILFRGKRKDNGEWFEGLLAKYIDGVTATMTPQYLFTVVDEIDFVVIDPETVGQYTGLTDKNGTKIFEGDFVATKYKLGRGGYYVFEVYYNENLCHFALTINSGSYTKNKQYDWLQLTELKANKIEVIGNIHDNPELLKGGEW